jgi:TFIIF-interacting CTD phosphatase-like protein
LIDTDHIIAARLYRDNCIKRNMHSIKDLRIVDRDISKCIAIDNSLIAFMEQLGNLIPIPAYRGNCSDHSLIDIAIFLNSLDETSDIMEALKAKYCLNRIYNSRCFKSN